MCQLFEIATLAEERNSFQISRTCRTRKKMSFDTTYHTPGAWICWHSKQSLVGAQRIEKSLCFVNLLEGGRG